MDMNFVERPWRKDVQFIFGNGFNAYPLTTTSNVFDRTNMECLDHTIRRLQDEITTIQSYFTLKPVPYTVGDMFTLGCKAHKVGDMFHCTVKFRIKAGKSATAGADYLMLTFGEDNKDVDLGTVYLRTSDNSNRYIIYGDGNNLRCIPQELADSSLYFGIAFSVPMSNVYATSANFNGCANNTHAYWDFNSYDTSDKY